MITLINPPGIKTFSGLQMHTPNPPLGLAYIAAAIKDARLLYQVIGGTGEALDVVRPYPDRDDFMIQGLSFDEITARIPPDADVIGVACMFSTLWPLVNKLAWAVREKFLHAWMVLGGEHGTAVPENVLKGSPFDAVVLGEGEDTVVELLRARRDGRSLALVKGIAFRTATGSSRPGSRRGRRTWLRSRSTTTASSHRWTSTPRRRPRAPTPSARARCTGTSTCCRSCSTRSGSSGPS
jgi:hypothetical protein